MTDLSGVTICATTAAWCCNGDELNWLRHAEAWAERGVRFVLALQTGLGDDARSEPLRKRVRDLGGTIVEFSIGDGVGQRVSTPGRLDYIVAGRNIATQRALRHEGDWLLFLDVDLSVGADAIDRLLEVDYPVIGGDVPSYCQVNTPTLPEYDFPVVQRWNTAGFLLVRHDVASKVRWRHEWWAGLTDDPCFDHSVAALGFPTRVRTDVVGRHRSLITVETRPESILRREDPVVVAIPVRDELALTRRVVGQLRDAGGFDHLWVYDNGSTDGTPAWLQTTAREDPRVTYRQAAGMGLYEMWNDALAEGARLGAYVCLLNNDLDLPPAFVAELTAALRSAEDDVWAVYPDPRAPLQSRPTGELTYTRGTKRHGGLTGHAFMVKGRAFTQGGLAYVDPAYRWWCGDDDLVAKIEQRGYTAARVDGLSCLHVNEATAQHHAWTHDAKLADLERFQREWGGKIPWA